VLVVDASVILKWLLEDPEAEEDTQLASELMRRVLSGEEEIIQPIHWLAEVSAVLSRLSPDSAVQDVEMLHALELPTRDDAATHRLACKLSIDLKQHVFDTLYHSVALETEGALLVTADERYVRASGHLAGITSLAAWGGR
jgi:predicted nucleic acid-binding protein